jgi:hypothetical protein
MKFEEFEERVKAITTDVVALKRIPPSGDEWLRNMCAQVCTNIRNRISSELGNVDNWEFVISEGLWNGAIPRDFRDYSDKHEWMCIKFNKQELEFDPTYIQYTRTEWSWEACKQAVIDNCYPVVRDDTRYSKSYNERASQYPMYKKE